MEKIPDPAYSKESLIKEVKEKVIHAAQHLLSYDNIEDIFDDLDMASEIKQKIDAATISVKGLFEFKTALQMIGATESQIEESLENNNTHANTAELLGAEHAAYNIILAHNGNTLRYIAYAQTYLPSQWDEKTKKEFVTKMASSQKINAKTIILDEENI